MDHARWLGLRVPFFLWFLFLVFCPFALVAITSFRGPSLAAYRELTDPLYFLVFLRTLAMAAVNTALSIGLAFPIAFYLSRLGKKEAATLLTFLMVPFWTNSLIRLLAFMDVLRFSPFGLRLTYSPPGIALALLYNYLPFAILPLYSTLEKIPSSLLEAALDLGASKRQVLAKVLWPLSQKGSATAALLVFIPSLGEFLIPEIAGGGKSYFLGTFLQQQFLVFRNWPLGAAAITLLVLFSVFLLWIIRPDWRSSV